MRKWIPFDQDTLFKEFKKLPKQAFLDLTYAMESYAADLKSGYVVDHYGQGLLMIKDDSKGSGRCLFFAVRKHDDQEVLTMLLVYKKESQEAPKRVIETARKRMGDAKDAET